MSSINWLEILGWGNAELDDLRFVGYSYIKQGLYDTALAFFEALVILDPENAYDHQTLGALYLEKSQFLKSLNYLEKALKLQPHHAPTLLNRTKALLALGYKRQGLAQAMMLEKNPESFISDQASALILAYS